MEKIDYKKNYKGLYQPKLDPALVMVPPIRFMQIDGTGDPNESGGEYQAAIEILYTLSYCVKMLPRKGILPPGYFDYVVAPLEGLWWMKNEEAFDCSNKSELCWTAMIRQPEFLTEDLFVAVKQLIMEKKPKLAVSNASLKVFDEGLCVQCLHKGSFATEALTLEKMKAYLVCNDYRFDLSMERCHHEIYLSDPRKVAEDKMKTVLRYPVAIL